MNAEATAEALPDGKQPRWQVPTPSFLENQPLKFVAETLRGMSQVDLLPNAMMGVFFVAALFADQWQFGVYGTLGPAVGTATAYFLAMDRKAINNGLYGFNSCLAAIAVATFLGPDHWSSVIVAFVACALASVVTATVARVFGSWGLPTFTAPFCVTATVMILGASQFQRIWNSLPTVAALPQPAHASTSLDWNDIWHAFFTNIGQVLFMPKWYAGLLFLIGIFVASRRAGVMAAAGSAVAILVAWGLGSPATEVTQGLMGYNAVLTAIALCGVFIVPNAWSYGYAIVGAAVSVVMTGTVASFFQSSGSHAFTWPFVLTAIVFLTAVPAIPRLKRM